MHLGMVDTTYKNSDLIMVLMISTLESPEKLGKTYLSYLGNVGVAMPCLPPRTGNGFYTTYQNSDLGDGF